MKTYNEDWEVAVSKNHLKEIMDAITKGLKLADGGQSFEATLQLHYLDGYVGALLRDLGVNMETK